MAESLLNLSKETYIQVQEAQTPKQNEPKETHTKAEIKNKE